MHRFAFCLLLLPAFTFAADLPDLGTRKAGFDWPKFLGPTADSVSQENGIIAPWPAQGLRIVWQASLGRGYAPPSISRGRLFHFDAHPDADRKTTVARLTCRQSETGKELWKFDYSTDYNDTFGYDNGPRCCPLVDGDCVYILGVEGMLHCISAADGKPIWKVDTLTDYRVIKNFFGVGSSPVIEGDLIIIPIGGSPKGSDPDDFIHLKGDGTAL